MGNNIRGITIELGGNTGPLNSALKDVNKAANGAQSELKEVNKQLKFDPKNVTLSTQKLDLMKQKAAALEEKQKTLKTAVEQAHAAFEKGDLGADKVRAVEREYEKVNSQMKETKKDLAAAEAESGTFTEKVKGKFSLLKDKIKDTFSYQNIKAGIGAIGIAVGTFLKGTVDDAKEAEKANADLEQSLKSTKGAAGMTMESLKSLSQAMVENTTFSDTEVKAGEGMLLTFTQIGKDVFPQAIAATLDYAQKMGVDAKSAALTLGKALNDPANGLAKLTKSGVTFTDQQKKQITAMQKAGDIAGAQKLMIEELNKEFGGQAAAAAETWDGKQKQIANTLKEIKEIIGTALIPALAALLKPITPIIEAVGNFVSKNPQLTAAILAVIAVIGTLIGGLTLANSVAGLFGHTMQVNEIIMTGGVMLAIMALVAAAIAVVTHWKEVSGFFIGLWDTIQNAFSKAVNWIKGPFVQDIQSIPERMKSFFSGLPNFFGDLLGKIKTNVMGGINSAKTAATAVFTAAVDGVKQKLAQLNAAFQTHKTQIITVAAILGTVFGPALIKSGIQAATAGAKVASGFIANMAKAGSAAVVNGAKITASFTATMIKSGAQAVASGAKITVSFIGSLVKSGAAAVANGAKVAVSFTATMIKAGAEAVVAGAKVVGSFVASLARSAAQAITTGAAISGNLITSIVSYAASGWKTVGAITAQTGAWVAQKAAAIASAVATKAMTAAQWLMNAAMSANPIGLVIAAIAALVAALVILYNKNEAFRNFVNNMWAGIRGGWMNVINGIKNAFASLNPVEWGKDLINGIANGIKSAAYHVRDAVGNVASTIRSFLHFSRPDTGDLRDYESWMPDFMGGLANGIRNSTAPVIRAAKGVASGIAASIKIPETVTTGVQFRTALAAAGGYSSGGSSGSDSISRSPIPGLTVIFKGNSFGDKEVAKTDVDKISNAIALKVQAKQ